MEDEAARLGVAYHEAGHAIVGALHGRVVFEVTIKPDRFSRGHVSFAPGATTEPRGRVASCPWPRGGRLYERDAPSEDELRKASACVQTSLAGPLSQTLFCGTRVRWGSDRRAAALAVLMYTGWGWHRIHRYLREQEAAVEALIREWEVAVAIDALARRLIVEEAVAGPIAYGRAGCGDACRPARPGARPAAELRQFLR